MNAIKALLFLFLSFTTFTKGDIPSDKLIKLQNDVESNGIISKRLLWNSSKVTIKDQSYEILFIEVPDGYIQSGFQKYTLPKLFTCINCEFAEWTQNELSKIVRLLPTLYSSPISSIHDSLLFSNFNVTKFNTIINDIMKHTEKFINILLNFISIHLNAQDTSADTDILETFLSFQFKSNLINALHQKNNANKKPLIFLTRIILEEYNKIHNFILRNCKLSQFYVNAPLFSLTKDDDSLEKKDINTFLDDLRPLNLESHKSCNLKQMLLHDIIPWKFGYIKWETEDGAMIIVKHAMRRIKTTYDHKVILWYQKYMFHTVMKLLFTKTLKYFEENNNIPEKIVDDFQIIYSNILQGVSNLPSDLIHCFSLLMAKQTHTYSKKNDLVLAITSYTDSLYDIQIEDDSHLLLDNNEGFHNIVVESNQLSALCALEEFILYLIDIADDLKCFIRLFEFLIVEHNKYYVPFSEDVESIKLFEANAANDSATNNITPITIPVEQNSDIQEFLDIQGCKFFRGLYQYLFEANINLNAAGNFTNDKVKREMYYNEACSYINSVKSHLIDLIDNYWSLSHIKIIYNITPIIELITKNINLIALDDLRRLVLIIMAEINSFNIQFCHPPENSLLFFNNINFGLIGALSSKVDNEILESQAKMKKPLDVNRSIKYSNIQKCIEICDINVTSFFAKYEYSINLNWRGTNGNIAEIFHSMSPFLSPPKLYSFYDIYFKSSLAITFFEICKAYKKPRSPFSIKNPPQIPGLNTLERKYPASFIKIIKNIKTFYESLIENNTKQKELEDIKIQILGQFESIGVSIDLGPFSQNYYKINDMQEEVDVEYIGNNSLLELLNFTEKVKQNFELISETTVQ